MIRRLIPETSRELLVARWRRPIAKLLFMCCVVLRISALPSEQPADGSEVAARVKAAFIYNFARFIEWPQTSRRDAIKIVVIGRGVLAPQLEEIVRGKSLNGRSLEVSSSSAGASLPRCDILVIERSEIKRMNEIVQALAGKPVLTVCDDAACLKEGGIIGFQLVDESVRFQINQEAATLAGLKISSQLLKVALPLGSSHP